MKKVAIILILLLLTLPSTLKASNYKAYSVLDVTYNDILITDGISYFLVDYNYECYSSDFSEGEIIYIDTYFTPGFWDTILVEGLFGSKTCKVSNSNELNLKSYSVEMNTGNEILIKDSYSNYFLLDYNYECYSSDFYKGDVIFIDTLYNPGYGDIILIDDNLMGVKTCEVTSSSKKDLKSYYVEEVMDTENKIIVEDNYGNSYLVEYTFGCSSMWLEEEKYILIDSGFSLSYNDEIYLIDRGQSCKVWDVEELNFNNNIESGFSLYNWDDLLNTQCIGMEDYIYLNGECITKDQSCKDVYGQYSYYDYTDANGNYYCNCMNGYVWNNQLNNEDTECIEYISSTQSIDTTNSVVEREKELFSSKDISLTNRLKGYILLQVESVGEAWYLHPEYAKKYYMKDGATAYQMLREFGLGITNLDLEKIPIEGSNQVGDYNLVNRLKGYILLQVEENGEAWYVNPADGKRYYMKNGEKAYTIMRELSLGITNNDLRKIEVGEISNNN